MIVQALEKILSDHCAVADVRRIEAGGSASLLWDNVEQGGFLELLAPAASGGAALPLSELFGVFECLGRYAMPLPIAQAIAARALVEDSQNLPAGQITLASRLQRAADGSVHCPLTPYGAHAAHVLAWDGSAMFMLSALTARRESVGDARALTANLHWDDASAMVPVAGHGPALLPFAAALVSALQCGIMQRTFAMSLNYCNQRVQFGKPLGKFQAIQQQLSVMAEHVMAGRVAAESAFGGGERLPGLLAAAMAKARTSEAGALVAATAHAVHGAIGVTDEYDLGVLTRRLHDWRTAYGAENHWNAVVGRCLLESRESPLDFVRGAWRA